MTRRDFVTGVSVIAIAAAGAGAFALPAWAQAATTVPPADLAQAGPLGDRAIGAENAPITIIEYASMTCPHCAHFSAETFPKLKERYIDTGKVRFIFREFPLDALAAGASMLARCADNDKYFPLVELLFSTQNQWAVQKPLDPLFKVVKQAGFTEDTFKSCLANQKLLDGIQAVRDRAANQLGVSSTPTFFINGKRVAGALSIEEMEKDLEPYLKA
jgi:protein-disulfide isomerase